MKLNIITSKKKKMPHNISSHIKSVEDVNAFLQNLVNESKLNSCQDDDFADYNYYNEKTPTFTEEDVSVYNMMEKSFDVCENANIDVYEIGLAVLRPIIGMN